ncbi:hypothetical protein Y1Q_0021115 [Alligator mississippiensis]|uniref:Uncharacterized protein n=1 Tax=Alligator mississippiensis TaxID=8496 RepID=A0A151NRQ9_ALLMI|nr:hypothetical protein Y1Q_0021115 [Alligator mississippiensis]
MIIKLRHKNCPVSRRSFESRVYGQALQAMSPGHVDIFLHYTRGEYLTPNSDWSERRRLIFHWISQVLAATGGMVKLKNPVFHALQGSMLYR